MMGYEESNVQKVGSGYEVDVFNETFFQSKIENTLNAGYEEVYQLKSFCTIYVSFIKGWGRYYKRKDLSSVPIWLEFKFVKPLQALDNILRELTLPDVKTEVIENGLY